MPLIRRLPKRGFNNAAFHKRYAIVNVSDLNAFEAGTVVNEQLLRESNLVRGHFAGIKILGEGELKHGLEVQVDKISTTAREKIEKAGGTVTLREAQRIEKSEAAVASSEAEPEAAVAADKPQVKKTKSRNKTSE
jgi:ribosomal protein L15